MLQFCLDRLRTYVEFASPESSRLRLLRTYVGKSAHNNIQNKYKRIPQ